MTYNEDEHERVRSSDDICTYFQFRKKKEYDLNLT